MNNSVRGNGPIDGMITIVLLGVAAVCGYQLYHLLSGQGDWFFGTTGIELTERAINVQIIAFTIVGLATASIATGYATKKVGFVLLVLIAIMGSGTAFTHNKSIIKRPEQLPVTPGPVQLSDGSLFSSVASGAASAVAPSKASSNAQPKAQGGDWNLIAKQKGYKRKTTANGKHIPLDAAGKAWCNKGGSHAALNAHAKAKGWKSHHLVKRKLDRDINCLTGFQHYKAK